MSRYDPRYNNDAFCVPIVMMLLRARFERLTFDHRANLGGGGGGGAPLGGNPGGNAPGGGGAAYPP